MNNFSERPSILDNPHAERVKKVAALAGRSARFKHGKILVEGPQAVRELIRHRSSFVEDVYYTSAAAQTHPDVIDDAERLCRWVHEVSDEVSEALSRDSQGICAVARAEAIETSLPEIQSGDTLVVIAQGRDPGNVGTIIRTADAMGARAIVSVKGSVDSSSPKVIRSSAGSVFHLPIVPAASFGEACQTLRGMNAGILGTSGAQGAYSLTSLMSYAAWERRGWLAQTHAWVFGNEAQGMSDDEMAACDALVMIPMSGQAESLNVASAAAMCLFASQSVRLG
ncbi:TrmH family RNA methyltransferase [Actinomyces sp. Marseille-QA0893]